MRRTALTIALGMLVASLAFAQESAATESAEPAMGWKWANFVILAGGLGYLIAKNAPALFRKRAGEIQEALAEGSRAHKEAQAQAASVELRLSELGAEIENLRRTARDEMAAAESRLRQETEQHLLRVQQQATQEIALLARAVKDDLRRYSAGLALDLAEQRVRSRMTAGTEDGLVAGFLHDLRYDVTQRART